MCLRKEPVCISQTGSFRVLCRIEAQAYPLVQASATDNAATVSIGQPSPTNGGRATANGGESRYTPSVGKRAQPVGLITCASSRRTEGNGTKVPRLRSNDEDAP